MLTLTHCSGKKTTSSTDLHKNGVKLAFDQRLLSLTMPCDGGLGWPKSIVIPSHNGRATEMSMAVNREGLMGQQRPVNLKETSH